MRLYHQYYKILDEQIIPDKEFSDMILISCKISSSVVNLRFSIDIHIRVHIGVHIRFGVNIR